MMIYIYIYGKIIITFYKNFLKNTFVRHYIYIYIYIYIMSHIFNVTSIFEKILKRSNNNFIK